jgi:hypothetical protein
MKKPCIECGNDCEILPVMLGDTFTLTYLRVCSSECMFIVAYDYLYEIGHHKDFRNSLYDKQNEEDKKECDEFIEFTPEEFSKSFRKNLEANPEMLSTPVPEGIMKMFADRPQIPLASSCTMRFTRPPKEDKVRWAKEHVERVWDKLKDAVKELERLENECEV